MDRSMLARATEGTDAPTPGYLYNDLTKAATANPMACHDMAQYLCNRLAHKMNVNVKTKCCKVLAKLADGVPRNQFRRAVAQDNACVTAIKEAMNWRGPMDPVRGDEPNQNVRTAAKAALDAIYREAPSSMESSHAGMPGGSHHQYGPSPHSNGGGGYSGSGAGYSSHNPRMQGVGNPMYADPRIAAAQQPSNFKEAMREAGDVLVTMMKDPLARNVQPGNGAYPAQPPYVPRQGHSGDLPGYNRSQTYGRPPPGASELSRQTGGQWTMASNRGPGAVNTEMPSTNYGPGVSSSAGTVGGSWGAVSSSTTPSIHINHVNPTISHQHHHTPSLTSSAAVADGSYEKNLVMELCPPGGLKPVPPADKLTQFCRNLPSLNADLICPVVLDCLEDGQPWIIRAKALCVIEACLQHGTVLTTGHNPYRDFFHACHEEIVPLAQHPRAPIQEPARRVLKLLGVAAGSEPTTRARAAAAPVAAPVNLLDFDEAPAPTPAAMTINGGGSNNNNNMFGGMQVKGPAPAAAPPPPPPAAEASASEDLLGDLMGESPAPAPTTTTTTTTTSTTLSAKDMFADMSVKEEKKVDSANGSGGGATEDAASVSSAKPGSAFAFINQDASSTASAPAAEAPAPSFDPLQNMTPQTAQRKMMTMSTEQMQAMAYQQNMWMQQQQQLQLAMMMQQQQMKGMPGRMMAPPQMPKMSMGHSQPAAASRPAQKQDHKFDFVMDAMKTAKK